MADARARCRLAALSLALLACLGALPPPALAAGNPPGQPAPVSAPPGTAVLAPTMTAPPTGFRLTGDAVLAAAKRNPTYIRELRRHPHLVPYVYTRGAGVWQVSLFTPLPPAGPAKRIEMLQLYVSDSTGQVTQVWTGYQVAWTMARGYPGAFGRRVNALYIWLPLCALFLLPFLPWRRRPTLWHLDLLMMLGFSASLAWFNNADLGLSVPTVYPFLVYLLVRMLLLAAGRGRPREPLRVVMPTAWLAILLIFLIGFRVGLNVTNSNVIDVGYAGVIGADKIIHGQQLYGHFPPDNPAGDTYGPINYLAYVPFRSIFGWSGVWDSLPAAHAAAISFDLLTMLGLLVLGWSLRGPTAGVVLAYLWAAYPFTSFVLMSNSNDALVALLIVACLVAMRFAALRGILGAFAGLTKFAPLGLAPLLWRGTGPWPPRRRGAIAFAVSYALAIAAAMLPVLLSGDLSLFWNHTIVYQASRPAPFSIWGLWGGYRQTLHLPEHIVLGAAVALGLAAPLVPRGERTIVQVAALGAAIIIGLQLGITYWFYLYIVWFFPLVVIALVLAHPDPREEPEDVRMAREVRAGLRPLPDLPAITPP
ncbi:MAG TPA: hypothetical protein VFN36_03565 [Solirubrobacteraceae bacterium]|nr:hypothetical protein [Solirubrobacteraceae bacterium]